MIYRKSSFGYRVISGGHQERPGTTGGGPPGRSTCPGGPYGMYVERDQPLSGLGTSPLGPMRLGFGGTLKGGAPLALGGKETPLAVAPLQIGSTGALAHPLAPYIYVGRERAATPLHLAPPFPLATPLPPAEAWRSPAGIPAASTTTPSCCWIFINLSFPLAGSRRRRRHANRTCVERGGAVRSALGSPVIWITTSTTPSTPFS